MVQKYQNEIAPIFYYGISTKTNEKGLKIPNLQPPDWKSTYWMTLYIRTKKMNVVDMGYSFSIGLRLDYRYGHLTKVTWLQSFFR